MQYIQQINFSCSECQQSVEVDVDEIREEGSFGCPNCFTTTIINTDAFLPAPDKLEKIAMTRALRSEKQTTI